MRLVRHCNEKLPGGLKLWRKLARMAGYRGIVEVRGFGTDALNANVRAGYRGILTLGYTMIVAKRIPVKMVIYLGPPFARCARFYPSNAHPLFTYAHELGHAWAAQHGHRLRSSHFKTYAEWRVLDQENWADRYAKRLLRRAGLGDEEGRQNYRRTLRPMGSL